MCVVIFAEHSVCCGAIACAGIRHPKSVGFDADNAAVRNQIDLVIDFRSGSRVRLSATLVERRLHLPKQTFVLWTGQGSDVPNS